MKIKFITAIYSNLYGTDFGGRQNRGNHYRWSLISLLRMTDADFVCYTSIDEINQLKEFFYIENGISKKQLKLVPFELKETKYFDLINKFKNVDAVKTGDRCFEIQYNKFFWISKEDMTYDYYYWIDSGLSHCGLIPDKYLEHNNEYQGYYNSYFFDNIFLKNLTKKTNDKILIIGKDNVRNFWSGTVPNEFYKNYDNSIHIIGGIFGGKTEKIKNLIKLFDDNLNNLLNQTMTLWFEEQILSLIYQNYKEIFEMFYFETWWHETNGPVGLPENYFEVNKSFYKVLEEIKYE